jgi:hypothetical protein
MAVRWACVIVGIAVLALGLGYVAQASWATATWPWPDGRLSYIFVGSILAAISMAFLWVGISAEYGSLAAGATTGIVTGGGSAIYLLQVVASGRHPAALFNAAVMAAVAVFGAVLFLVSRPIPIRDARPMPRPLRLAFVTFIVALVLAASALVLRVPAIFPWPLNPDSSVLFGWIFYGDACYFLYALLLPRWHNAKAQLLSFLAYDVILLPPFLPLFTTVAPDHRTSLIIYTGVLLYSLAVAVYYLLVDPSTRDWRTRPASSGLGALS